jgi:hypothetical protein
MMESLTFYFSSWIMRTLATIRYPALMEQVNYRPGSIFMLEMFASMLTRWRMFEDHIQDVYVELLRDTALDAEAI